MRTKLTLLIAAAAIALSACVTTGVQPSNDTTQLKTKLALVCTQASAINDVLMASQDILDKDVIDQIAVVKPYFVAVCSADAGLTDLQSFAKGGIDSVVRLIPMLPIAQEKKQQALLAIALTKVILSPLNAQ